MSGPEPTTPLTPDRGECRACGLPWAECEGAQGNPYAHKYLSAQDERDAVLTERLDWEAEQEERRLDAARAAAPDGLREAAQALLSAWRRVDHVVYFEFDGMTEDDLLASGLTLDEPMDALRAAMAQVVEP